MNQSILRAFCPISLLNQRLSLPFPISVKSSTLTFLAKTIAVPLYNLNPKRFAGHSHWQNIKHIKMAKDASKGTTFNFLVNQIKLAIRDNNGNVNPETNDRLAEVLKIAKNNQLPRATIDRVIKRWKADNEQACDPSFFGVQGPGGAFIILECLTNRQKDVQVKLNGLVKKCALKSVEVMTMMFAFQRKGVIRCINSEPFYVNDLESGGEEGSFKINRTLPKDKMEEVAIEAGAEEVSEITDAICQDGELATTQTSDDKHVFLLEFVCDVSEFHRVKSELSNRFKLPIKSADLEYIPDPLRMVKIQSSLDRNLILKFLGVVGEHIDTLSKIYSNIDMESLYQTGNNVTSTDSLNQASRI